MTAILEHTDARDRCLEVSRRAAVLVPGSVYARGASGIRCAREIETVVAVVIATDQYRFFDKRPCVILSIAEHMKRTPANKSQPQQ